MIFITNIIAIRNKYFCSRSPYSDTPILLTINKTQPTYIKPEQNKPLHIFACKSIHNHNSH